MLMHENIKTNFMKIIIALAFLLCASQAFALNPSRTYKQLPTKYNMKYTAHTVKTNDGKATLKAWYFTAKKKTNKLILISHNGEGNMADYLRRVDAFTSSGFNVVIYDYRGFGESSEFEIDKNMYVYPHFLNDIQSMFDFCRKNISKTFSVYGWGMGASLSIGVGYRRTEIDKIIADTPFLSLEDLEYRFSLAKLGMEAPFAGYDKRFEPIYAVSEIPGKNLEGVLLIVGSNDVLFSETDLEAIAEESKLKKTEIHVVENQDRKDNFSVDKKKYKEKIISFLNG